MFSTCCCSNPSDEYGMSLPLIIALPVSHSSPRKMATLLCSTLLWSLSWNQDSLKVIYWSAFPSEAWYVFGCLLLGEQECDSWWWLNELCFLWYVGRVSYKTKANSGRRLMEGEKMFNIYISHSQIHNHSYAVSYCNISGETVSSGFNCGANDSINICLLKSHKGEKKMWKMSVFGGSYALMSVNAVWLAALIIMKLGK